MKPASKKRISTQLRQLNKMLWVAFPLLSLPFYVQAENKTSFSDSSLTGIQKTYGPNVTLALSVEFPTAGAAYSTATEFTNAMMSQTFLGYFDNTKCYEYVAQNDPTGMLAFTANGYRQDSGSDNVSKDKSGKPLLAPDGTQALAGKRRPWIVYYEGHRLSVPDSIRSNNMLYESIRQKEFFLYDRINTNSYDDDDSMGTSGAVNHKYETNEREYFRPTRTASTSNGMVGVCDGPNEFSGNFMNWATMSAIDIFRQAMTGGNRALGVAKDTTAYEAGDTPTRTFLRRANVVREQNAHYMQRTVALSEENIKKVLPHDYAVDRPNPILADRGQESSSNKFFLYKGYIPHPYAYRIWLNSRGLWEDETKQTTRKAMMGQVTLATSRPLLVRNSGFGVDFRRAVHDTSNSGWYNNAFRRDDWSPRTNWWSGDVTRIGNINDGQNGRYWAPVKSRVMPYQVTVEACVPGKLEANCVLQPSGSYKPEGLMQQNASTMRFAAFGYANIAGNTVSGGVLRSRMRYIANPNKDGATATGPAVKYQEEIDPRTGQFYLNPDRNAEGSAQQAFTVNTDKKSPSPNFDNSGTINYLNKFGDYNNYKTNDPGAELYYTALRYLRHAGFPALYKTKLAEAAGNEGITKNVRDNFPLITDNWDNPLDVFSNSTTLNVADNVCRPNYIIYIGDTNTHADASLPGGGNTPYDSNVDDDRDIHVRNLINEKIRPNEPRLSWWNGNWGADASPGGAMAALALWGRTNDLQPDFGKRLSSFMIDTVEDGKFKPENNNYWLAAKYGGFNDLNNNGVPDKGEWEATSASDKVSAFEAPAVSNGTPQNFAVANNPTSMVAALNRAFEATATAEAPSATSLGTTSTKPLSERGKTMLLQSVFRDATTVVNGARVKVASGDVLGLEAILKGHKLEYEKKWSAGEKLQAAYHNANGWTNRKVFTRANANSGAVRLVGNNSAVTVAVGGSDAADLVNYALGAPTYEDGRKFRIRPNHLMGTVINSPVVTIPSRTGSVSTVAGSCTYPAYANIGSRPNRHVVAANDGMFYVLDNAGNEIASYMPSTALSQLARYASPNYSHFFMNDGIAATAEVCFTPSGQAAHTVVVGTAGRGGNSVYALDLTKPTDLTESDMLWEFTHDGLGKSLFAPIITHDITGVPVAIVSSGYNAKEDNGYVYVLKLNKPVGSPWVEDTHPTKPWGNNGNWYRIKLGAGGVGELFAYQTEARTVAAVYAGDLEGKLWKVSQNAEGRFVAGYVDSANNTLPIFKTADKTSIVGAPFAQIVGGKTYVVFITGRYFNKSDLPSTTQTVQNYAYGIIESKISDNRNPTASGALIEDGENLLQQHVEEEIVPDNVRQTVFYKVTNHQITNKHQGWKLKLQKNWLSIDKSAIRGKRVAEFSAVNPLATDVASADNMCTENGSTYSLSVNVFNGGVYNKPIYDTNGDGKFTEADTLVSVAGQAGILTRLTEVSTEFGRIVGGINSMGNMIQMPKDNITSDPVVKRVSWREIF
ncbi:PilC/PilY family type IV pilus protein [Kingella kingae]|uniref:pilus assembly protein n=1 Tax=Kingella kingae TaxID=504 RepID=UPI00254BE8A6|nr:PilC/PilY family type IV pilus protein [Kingella kingae]MDK4563708.1 PilC/PilY family type IV pilus protein [Kingella kingae]MDK4577578.1 PilC/PilY family type IV pilus protein [Kingella kingae]MDK4608108.1 PilC/PilY family type IV pilus protein [Kingella kingae]MDK4626091.1 PilC/PilY family type IV pilus protein [Kingella kingae]MDK4673807.1 PilC/PilY family type IV pilus protein [Kingella kingae]